MARIVESPSANDLIRFRHFLISVLLSAFANPTYPFQQGNGGAIDNPFLVARDDSGFSVDSKLIIADLNSEELKAKDPRPMIITTKGDVNYAGSSINDDMNYGWGGAPREKQLNVNSTGLINCYARKNYECELLAGSAAMVFVTFKDLIRVQSNLTFIGDPTITPPTQRHTDSETSLFKSTISIPIEASIVLTITKTQYQEFQLKVCGCFDKLIGKKLEV